MREDASRVLYPPYVHDPSWPTRWLSDIQIEEDIVGSAFRVHVGKDKRSYIYKKVDRPFYQPGDTAVIQQKLQNLKLFRGASNIVQLSAIVISTNPYQTMTLDENLIVIRGFLLEYHPGGSLEQRLNEIDATNSLSRRWALQIGYGLLVLHQEKITHMDLKPSNIVIDSDDNAILIDISGIGCVIYEWLAPELRHEDALSFPLEARKLNDVWAYGKLLSVVARSVDESQDVDLLLEVATNTTKEEPELRIGLAHAISKLNGLDSEISPCAPCTLQYERLGEAYRLGHDLELNET
jgi:tRNA A-37 threonylcarbamoyl transferase component Bud32